MKIREPIKTCEGDIWFMSDLHYGHANVLRFDGRPFSTVEEMNNSIEMELIEKIKPTDVLFDLGDLFWKQDYGIIKKVLSLMGPKKFYKVMGNHDKESVYQDKEVLKYIDIVSDILDIVVEHEGKLYQATLSHYPIVSWNNKPRGSFMLHGHTHGNIDNFNNASPDLRVDLGYYASLARETGSFLINFKDILGFFIKKAGTEDFRHYVLNNCKEL
jgi:calcineurin-like phosphoesterase family protein